MEIDMILTIVLSIVALATVGGFVTFAIRANDNQKALAISSMSAMYNLVKDPAKQFVIDELPSMTESLKVHAKQSEAKWDDLPAELLDRIADAMVERMNSNTKTHTATITDPVISDAEKAANDVTA